MSNIVNIHTDYDWTAIPRNSPYRADAPHIKVISYKVTSSAALNRLRSYLSLLDTDVNGFYENLYKNVEQVKTYFIPYFGDNVRSFSNEFGDTFQNSVLGNVDSMINKLAEETAIFSEAQVAENVKKLGTSAYNMGKNALGGSFSGSFKDLTKGMSTAPGSYIETPKMYVYAQNDSSLDVSFPLYNTINPDAWENNYNLIDELVTINRPKRITPITMEQPYLYEIVLPGIRYMRWAFCSSLSVSLLGSRRIIDSKIIPDGYQVNMSFVSLTTEVSNFMEKSRGASTISGGRANIIPSAPSTPPLPNSTSPAPTSPTPTSPTPRTSPTPISPLA
jgi:hypothetical protein